MSNAPLNTTEPQNTPGAKGEKSQHTTTPWGVCVNSKSEFDIVADGGGGDMIADLAFRGADGEADADFIVRACNAHDALVAALKSAQIVLGMLVRPETDGANVPLHIAFAQCLLAESKCRAALALATSEVQS